IGNACSADISGEETHRTITPTQSTAEGRAFFRMSRQREHTGTRQPLGFACPVCFADGRNRSLPRRNQAGAPRSSPSGPAARQGVECSKQRVLELFCTYTHWSSGSIGSTQGAIGKRNFHLT